MYDMTEGKIARHIFRFTIPLLIGNVFQQFYNMADAIIVGQFVGKGAMAAVGISFPVMFVAVSSMIGVTMGVSVLVSQFFGAKEIERIRRTVSTGYIFTFFMSIALMFVGIALNDFIQTLLRTPADIREDAKLYLFIIFLGVPFSFGYNLLASVLRGVGDSQTPLYLLIFSTTVNVFLDLFFVLALKQGVGGAAIATVISQALAFFLGIYFMIKKNTIFRLHRKWVFDKQIFKQSIFIGFPAGVQHAIVGIGMMCLFYIVNRFGADVLAGYTAAMRIESFAMMPIFNFGMAITVFVGQNLGAGKLNRVHRGVVSTLVMTLSICAITSSILGFFPNYLISIFNRDVKVIEIGSEYLRIVSGFYFFFAIMSVYTGVLRGAGDTFVPMLVAIFSQFILRVPLSAYLSTIWGTRGIWWGVPIAWGAGMVFLYIYYKVGYWKRKVKFIHTPFENALES